MKYRILLLISTFLLSFTSFGAQKIIVLGDSLTEGYGLDAKKAFPAQLQALLLKDGHKNLEVINLGLSGSTTASGLKRLKWSLKSLPKSSTPNLLIIALGANDGLRGLKLEDSKKNLQQIIIWAKESGLTVILAGMEIPPNYGSKYTQEFRQMFSQLSKEHQITLIPFLLEGVATRPEMNLPDTIHPNEKGHGQIALTVKKYIEPHLK